MRVERAEARLAEPDQPALGVRARRIQLIDEGDDVLDEETLQPAVRVAVVVSVPWNYGKAGRHQGEVIQVLQVEQAGLLQAVAELRVEVGHACIDREHVEEPVGFARRRVGRFQDAQGGRLGAQVGRDHRVVFDAVGVHRRRTQHCHRRDGGGKRPGKVSRQGVAGEVFDPRGAASYESRVEAGRSNQRADWMESGCLRDSVVADRSRYLGPRRVAQLERPRGDRSRGHRFTECHGHVRVREDARRAGERRNGGDGGRCRVRGTPPPPTGVVMSVAICDCESALL